MRIRAKQIEQFEIEDLPKLGWIQITSIGEENVYFRFKRDTHVLEGFVKCL